MTLTQTNLIISPPQLQSSPDYTENKIKENETVEKTLFDNNSSQEDLQISKVNRNIKRTLPSLPEANNRSCSKEDFDAPKGYFSCDKKCVDGEKKVKYSRKKGQSTRAAQAKVKNPDPDVKKDTEPKLKQSETPLRPNFQDRHLLGVFVHQMHQFMNFLFSHLRVKIHVVDSNTGYYVKREESPHHAFPCKQPEDVEYILPIMTQPSDLKKSLIPTWEEQIIFNRPFGYFIDQSDDSPKVLLFFEILGFISAEKATANVDVEKHDEQPRTIAWAFLKIVGSNGVLNTDSKLNLQLYCPPQEMRQKDLNITETPATIDVYKWWKFCPRHQYPSALHVTVRGIRPPGLLDPESPQRKLESIQWSRLPEQVCQIPNKPILSFHGGKMGCLTVLFSHAGTMLAAACADRGALSVIVYQIPSGKVLATFCCHFKVIHDLCWSIDDHSLLSASSDGTVKEWNVKNLCIRAQKVLSHPSFVYCAQYHPAAQNLVLTGSYDAIVRVWRVDVDEVNGQLLLEFEGHCGFINTICFDAQGRRMFSGDSTGLIIVWETHVFDDQQIEPYHLWHIERKITKENLSGVSIDMLQVHPSGSHLLVHARDNVLRMMDLKVLLMKEYTGATNNQERIYSTFTPCGTYIFSGSEDGRAYVWNTETGDLVAIYSELWYTTGVHGVAFHPHENMVAFCAFGQPIHVYLYDPNMPQMGVQDSKEASEVLPLTKAKPPGAAPINPASPDTSASLALNLFGQTRLVLKIRAVMKHLDSVLGKHQISTLEIHHEGVPFVQTGRSFKHLFQKEGSEEEMKLYKGQFRLQQSEGPQKVHSELTARDLMRQQLSNNEEDFKKQLSLLNQHWESKAQQWTWQKAELEKTLMQKEEAWRLKEEENKREIRLLQQEILFLQVNSRLF